MFEYETFSDVIDKIPYFIEEVYNKKGYILYWTIMALKSLNINLIKISLISWC
ncbi:hypothetical protein ES705_02550 [subsurface metagenome]|nr:hypothetical protein [Clostridia bacterium]